jgi:hypothetical protein
LRFLRAEAIDAEQIEHTRGNFSGGEFEIVEGAGRGDFANGVGDARADAFESLELVSGEQLGERFGLTFDDARGVLECARTKRVFAQQVE